MPNPEIRYLLLPGMVKSKNDGQHHYVGAMRLARLYGVNPAECEIYEPAPWWPGSSYRHDQKLHKGLIRLTVRHDGNYTLPGLPAQDENTTEDSND